MKITDVMAHPITARWTDDPYFGTWLYSAVFIRVRTDSELEGVGEATISYFTPESVVPMVEFFKPSLVGEDPMQVGRLARVMYDDAAFWSREGAGRSVISGIELALWDLVGKALNVPVCQLLGGAVRDRVPTYASGGSMLWPIERNIEKVEFYMGLGYRAAKLATHFTESFGDESGAATRMGHVEIPHARVLDTMCENFDGLRRRFGEEFDFAIDGHQGATPHPIPVSEAVEIAHAMAPYRLRFYEEPLAYTDLDSYVELRARSRIPIAGGESMCGLDGFHHLIARHGVHLIQPDVGFAGGLGETQRIIHHAEAYNIGTVIHTGASFGPVLAASWHLAAATRSVQWLERVVAAHSIQDEFMIDRLALTDGAFGVPSAPGLGVRLTDDLLAKYRFQRGTGERT